MKEWSIWDVLWAVLAVFILAGMLLPALNKPRRHVKCDGNLRQIGLALIIYAADDDSGHFPDERGFSLLHAGNYLADGRVWGCPSLTAPSTSAARSDYNYRGAGLKDSNASAATVVIVHHQHRQPNNKTGAIFVFADGHVEWVPFETSLEATCEKNGWILPPLAGEASIQKPTGESAP